MKITLRGVEAEEVEGGEGGEDNHEKCRYVVEEDATSDLKAKPCELVAPLHPLKLLRTRQHQQ